MTDRRYSEEEVAAIFRAAAEQPAAAEEQEAPVSEGLTLGQLQAIGREVGLTPEAIAQAAQAVAMQPVRARTFLGMPLAVNHTVQLQRRLSDDEWDRLVVQLREVFGARGSLRTDGSLRQWSNGNLHVLLEPTATGHRLRFGTTHGGARAGIAAGLVMLGSAGVTAIATALTGTIGQATTGIAVMLVAGTVLLVNRAVRLPFWARTRARQMASLASGLLVLPPSAPPAKEIAPPPSGAA
jgi:hypothetical protein